MGNTSKQTNIERRRRLQALYERGRDVRFGPNGVDVEPTEDDVVIFVGPPSPLHRDMAIREAQAARARAVLDIRKESDSETALSARAFVSNLELDDLLDYILGSEDTTRMAAARRAVLAEKEWDDFNSLRDAMRQFEEAGSPFDDPEWKPLLDRDVQFGEQVAKKAEELKDAAREGLKLLTRQVLEDKALNRRIDMAGSGAFMKQYEEAMLFYGCRDPEDHTQLFFESIQDLKTMPEEIQDALSKTLASFITEAGEAKNLPAAGSGSASSETPKEPETSPNSSPEELIDF